MKKFLNFATYAILLAFALSFTSCSNEEPLDIQLDEKQTLTANSATTKLIERTVSNDGSHDNIVDGSSCFDIRFPYTVMVNGLEITIDSEDDLEIIEELFDALDSDDDILDIIFPITVTKADYTEITINSIADLRELAKECIEGGDDDDIECIDVVYPVTLFTYNPNLEQTGSVTVNSDKEMRRFFAGLSETDVISIEFPVMFEMFDGTKVTANNNEELADAMERAKEACDEDDDNDHNDDDFTKERLDNLLVECPWLVKELRRSDLTQGIVADAYADYVLNFKEDSTVVARDREGNMLEGEWSTKVTDYRVKLTLEFEFIEAFSLEWFVYEIDKDRIKLYIIGADGDKLILKRVCEEPMVECTEAFIKETLLDECVWAVSDGNNEYLDDFRMDFTSMNIHVRNPNETVVDEGNWEISGTTITFNNLSMEMANYIGEWEIIECRGDRFKMKRGDQYLVIEKDCE
ncbi:hypothetical protein FEE95_01225 [Maribacter algarum]|uniref:Lipoprotein n=1 Tax=Maribacter algarum (ex Zhang et al. 2020) TaxID=2578118 RepID=A0A5S3PSV1_9FLAO|nr:hypothetical protein [Maribacter algarum]TMM58076.1 hypothetical protein FEE95_01225 [Maribacter algarum]